MANNLDWEIDSESKEFPSMESVAKSYAAYLGSMVPETESMVSETESMVPKTQFLSMQLDYFDESQQPLIATESRVPPPPSTLHLLPATRSTMDRVPAKRTLEARFPDHPNGPQVDVELLGSLLLRTIMELTLRAVLEQH
ncbi:uncharacterized protein LOC131023700 [Salvia miltiorrhiza]|uniref:uncharacterized protein LOC131023700 n=1 Tax=Salvia miltiorrhiza TaxID=226208 RepID=UPI0025AC123D|nr:uncharacterized protein LOC131023700 [Salvia miltiorrhiza]